MLSAAVFCVAATAAHAQTVLYSTNFDSTDTFNGAPAAGFTPYDSSSTVIDNLAGQNGWGTTDPTGALGNPQVDGGTNYVGNFGTFFGSTFAGAIGGNQRSTAANASAATPDVVPSTGSLGLVSLYHAIPTSATSIVMSVGFVVTGPTSFTNKDTFAFSLRNAAGTMSLISINFVPTADVAGTPSQDNVTVTAGSTTGKATGSGVILNSQYILRLTVNSNLNYSATLSDSASNLVGAFDGTITGAGLTLRDVGRFSADLSLADKTTNSGGGLTGAGDNALAFDNLVITIPEPSTNAMLALGLVGLAGSLRLRRQRA